MDTTYQTIIDSTDANNIYYGYAELWRATTDAFWRLKLKNTAWSVVTEMYPTGTAKIPTDDFSFKWSERDHYNYSLIPDLASPTLSTVTIASNNSATTLAKVWDIVTLTIVSSEAIYAPTATIWAWTATIVAWVDELHWTATRTMTSDDVAWVVTFSIDFIDKWWNIWTTVTALTWWSAVTFDKVAPTAAITYSVANPSHSWDTQVITATFSEPLKDSPVVKIALAWSNVVSAS